MMIIHNDGMGVTNMDNVTRICLSGRYIHAYTIDGNSHPIAVYETPERAKEVFDWMISGTDCKEMKAE